MRYILLIAVFLILNSCKPKPDKSFIENWKSYPISDSINYANHLENSSVDWSVSLKDNKIYVDSSNSNKVPHPKIPFSAQVKKVPPLSSRGNLSFIKVEDGYLIGSYRGEWGGDLWWFSTDGNQHYKISDHEIVQFIQCRDKTYAIVGLDHMGRSEGSIIEIDRVKGKWLVNSYQKLPSAPAVIAFIDKCNFIVATSQDLLKIDTNKILTTLIEKVNWVHPNSIVINKDDIFIGARNGVYKYNLTHRKNELLLNN